jgi:hypothetical protein
VAEGFSLLFLSFSFRLTLFFFLFALPRCRLVGESVLDVSGVASVSDEAHALIDNMVAIDVGRRHEHEQWPGACGFPTRKLWLVSGRPSLKMRPFSEPAEDVTKVFR